MPSSEALNSHLLPAVTMGWMQKNRKDRPKSAAASMTPASVTSIPASNRGLDHRKTYSQEMFRLIIGLRLFNERIRRCYLLA